MRSLGAAPGTFVAAYHDNRQSACALALEQSPVAAAMVAMLSSRPGFECTPNELLELLSGFRPGDGSAANGWPRSPWTLSKTLRRLAPQLREIGILVTFSREFTGRMIKVAVASPENRHRELA
jgi:hypothetical protein